jgi:3D-(3,5/4)-trihydroxycyclohexane-1,2-dione acylhydrolase (decyclizing)
MGTGGAEFNCLLEHAVGGENSNIDFAKHAEAMGATALKVASIAELEEALAKRHDIKGPYVVVIDTDPYPSTEPGGTWWEVGTPEVSDRAEVNEARARYEANKKLQRAD